MVNHDPSLSVSIDATHSVLTLSHVVTSYDSGNYTCAPHNLIPDSIVVHILDEDSNSAAAIHTGDETSSESSRDKPAAGIIFLLVIGVLGQQLV
jgi:hypothetical protein